MQQKRAVLLHGTSGDPSHGWQPWLKRQLEERGYDVFAPVLPNNDHPDRDTYEAFLCESGWDFSDNIIVGHSSGATTALNLLLADWFPKASAVVLVGTFLNEKLTKPLGEFPDGLFDGLFLDSYDPKQLAQKARAFYFVHGSDDPYCDIDDAKQLCEQVGGTFIEITGGHHLGGASGITELPQLITALDADGITS
ncbi:alpha/beta fold hydrolase [Patescibacteria group bacterium]|nr:MAG: alpha/beta fold hydrolase [Patescibacteria group bacterium]